tara:strand:+ start:4616 stop:5116 length:501 start_codon:yes stop_codon:yes gene_type:complete
MQELHWYAEVEYDNPDSDYDVLVEDTFASLLSRLVDAKDRGFDSYLGSCPNLRVLEVGNKDGQDLISTYVAQKSIGQKNIKERKLQEGGDDAHHKVDSASFVKSLPSAFILDAVTLFEGLWTCTDNLKHQGVQDMEHSLQEISDRVWRFQVKYTEEIESIKKHRGD